MKKKLIHLFFGLFLLTTCQQPTTVDLKAERAAVNAVFDKFEATTMTDTLATFLSEDALVSGTAPAELFTKEQTVEMWKQYYSGKVPEHTYISERIVKIASDGNSATVIEEYIMPSMSPVIPARNTLHLMKTDGKWMIDFISIAFIPKNEDVPKIDKALGH
jgi:hypothetical protein